MNTKSAKVSFLTKAVTTALATGAFFAQAEQQDNLEVIEVHGQNNKYQVEKSSNHKIATDILDTAKTIAVLPSELLQDQGVTTLNDALRNVAGVSTFGAGEGGGGNVTTSDKITLRGFSANGSIYIDGVRDLAGYSRDMFNTEMVEVSKGANSSINGKGTSGGAVNLVTKKANFYNAHASQLSYDEAERLRLTQDSNVKLSEQAAVRLNLLYQQGGDPQDNGVEDYKTLAVAPAVTWQANEQLTLNADALIMSQDNTPMLGLPYINDDAAAQLNLQAGPLSSDLWNGYYGIAARDFEEVDVALATLVANYQLSENSLIRNQTRIGQTATKSVLARPMLKRERDPDTRLYTYFNEVDLTPVRALDEEFSLVVNQLDLITQFKTGELEHYLVVGNELYRERKTSQNLVNTIELAQNSVAIGAPNPNIGFTGSISANDTPNKTDGTGIAFYALDTVSFNNWLLTAGVRYENYDVEGSMLGSVTIDGKRQTKYVEGLTAKSDFLSWNSSLGFKPTESSFVYVSAANSQEPPAGDLAFSRRLDGIEQTLSLDPQEAKNIELGAKTELLDGKLLLSGAYFSTTKQVSDRDDEGRYFLAGEQEAKGLEVSATGNLTKTISLLASYTHQNTEVTKDFTPDTQGNGLTAAPEDTASLWLNYAPENWQLGLGANYNSGETFWRQNRAFYESPSYTLIDMMARYELSEKSAIQLNISNLTDKEYVTDFSARGHFRPGQPRTARITFMYNF